MKIESFTHSKKAKEHSLKHSLAISTRLGTEDAVNFKPILKITLWQDGQILSEKTEKLNGEYKDLKKHHEL